MTGRIGEKGQKQRYRISNANHYYCCDLQNVHCKEHCHQIHNVEYYEVKKIFGTINTCQSYLIINFYLWPLKGLHGTTTSARKKDLTEFWCTCTYV